MDLTVDGHYWRDKLTEEDDGRGLEGYNFSVTQDTQETEMPVQPSARAPPPRNTRPNSKRSKNFDPKEDVVVVAAWLNTSKDPVNGANQPRASFWSRIHDFYETHKTTEASRTESSIMHRWMTILDQVNKFCACYEAIERRNRSGVTIQDKVSDAAEMFKGLDKENKTFTLMHCWNKLKDEDKWKTERKRLAEQQAHKNKKKAKINADSTPGNVQVNNNEDVNEIRSPESEPTRERPIGSKAAKEALRRRGGEACMEALDNMWARKEAFDIEKEKKKEERFMASFELEKKRLWIEEQKVESDLIEKENKIMSIDISNLDLLQQQYYTTMRQQIVARRLANQN